PGRLPTPPHTRIPASRAPHPQPRGQSPAQEGASSKAGKRHLRSDGVVVSQQLASHPHSQARSGTRGAWRRKIRCLVKWGAAGVTLVTQQPRDRGPQSTQARRRARTSARRAAGPWPRFFPSGPARTGLRRAWIAPAGRGLAAPWPRPGTPSADPSRPRPGLRPGARLLPWRPWSASLLGGALARPRRAPAPPRFRWLRSKAGTKPDAPPRPGTAPAGSLPAACAAAAATAAGARGCGGRSSGAARTGGEGLRQVPKPRGTGPPRPPALPGCGAEAQHGRPGSHLPAASARLGEPAPRTGGRAAQPPGHSGHWCHFHRLSAVTPAPVHPLGLLALASPYLPCCVPSPQHDIEQEDPRRTPLELAVSLGNLESVRVLLRHNANVGKESCQGWAVLQEAVSTGDPEMVQLVLQYRDYQRAMQRLAGIPELLNKLRQGPDFYVEMKWEFTSWVPLVSKMCPSDVYRVWKRGESLRVDTSLLGFEHMTWQRGRRSFIFKGQEAGALVMEVDHDRQVVHTETLGLAARARALLAAMRPSEEHVASRLTSPIASTHLDTAMWPREVSWGLATPSGRDLVQASGRLSHRQRPLGWGMGVTAGPVTPGPPASLGPVTPSGPCTPVCTGSCLPGRRLGQGVPSFLTSDLTCFP
uniref:Ankyrin repeat domain-containing protein n=1 Tax=Bos mutus grunniens TaxID=30521 RepID=A0A8B9Y784_BOSMU